MKKIIKYGTIPTYRATCIHCGTEFEYDDRDVKVDISYPSIIYRTTCPLCDKRIEIKREDVNA